MNGSTTRGRVALLGAAVFVALPWFALGDWPQWRGPDRDGSVPGAIRTGEWPTRLSLVWKKEIGEGYSGPVVSGERLWVQARQGEQEVVRSLRLSDGQELWARSYAVPFVQDASAAGHGLGPYSTPSLAGDRLFTISMTAVLSVWNADDGTLFWTADYSAEFDPPYTTYGASASPLVWRGLCFMHVGGPKRRDLGNPGPGAMVALRVTDGKEVWRWTSDSPNLGASPVIHEIAGQPQLIFKSRDKIVGLDPRDGTELWRIPWRVPMDNTIVTPLLVGDRLITSDYEKGVTAWRLEKNQMSWIPGQAWHQADVYSAMSSPVIAAGQLVGLSYLRRGQLYGLDLEGGQLLWRHQARWGDYASLVSWGDTVLIFRQDGQLVVGKPTRTSFLELRRYRVWSGDSWAYPAVTGDRILVRNDETLAAYKFFGE